MALIKWNNSLSVGVTEIDQQHIQLISLINELNSAMQQRKGKDVLGKTLESLANYTITHFKTEEKYFALYRYPATASHKEEHAAFVNKISELQEKFDRGTMTLSIDLMNFLGDWLKKHINGTDKKYSAFFNEKGLK